MNRFSGTRMLILMVAFGLLFFGSMVFLAYRLTPAAERFKENPPPIPVK